ncbi:hypothetical protein PP175_27940 (plasmid) [Aneurinibacillus sp. Ricciae_BoGa-3]|uniref:hypothetical protein n=1 Tax=Aneurinibacillus sp. Ricciae_BoGa-3 TaxID=3022697 RepID=UPI002341C823|nr:hypothetical protein [Aneurinibacillus sp. Ricciae_BoGa-3]WCK57024.1 hypothetical protein PP175_27940 [Aneurinibacillus sp. Ricciae_BoGa-3]
MHHLDWWQQQQQKKADAMRGNDIFLINQSLQRVLQQVQQHINREDYRKEAQKVQRYLVQCSVWKIGYRNNMENENVALEQALFIQLILSKEEIPHKAHLQKEVDRFMRQLGNLDWGMYGEYNRRKQSIR